MMELKNNTLFRNEAFIIGQWVGAADGAKFLVKNPFDGSHLADDAIGKGATVLTGAIVSEKEFFFQPTILTGVSNIMAIAREEIFGSVVPVFKFEAHEYSMVGINTGLIATHIPMYL